MMCNMKNINIEMADILEVDLVDDTIDLSSFSSWDSLAILSILAFIDSEYNVNLTNDDINDIKNLSDLKTIVKLNLK